MANIVATDEFNFDLLNLYNLRYGGPVVGFLNNYSSPGLPVLDYWYSSFGDGAVLAAGKTLSYSSSSKLLTSGTVTLFGEGSDAGEWSIQKVSVSAKSLTAAMKTKSTVDDFKLFSKVFAGEDLFELSEYDDLARGYGGNDRLFGGVGNDSLFGGSGHDVLAGDWGADYLVGNVGADYFYAGDEDQLVDQFIYYAVKDSTVKSSGRDTIYDFEGGIDEINLELIDANTKLTGNQSFAFSGSAAEKYSVWYKSSGEDVLVYGDVNGDAKADFAIKLMNIASLTADDFLL